MPPKLLFDIAGVDMERVVYDQEKIRTCNPQRGDMEMLNGIVHANPELGQIIGFKDVREDEFWVPGHIPGRPLFPGVLMIESAAQLASFYTRMFVGWKGFIGFGGVEETKFRQQVQPGCRLYLFGQKQWERHHRIKCTVHGMVNGNLVFETGIVGTEM
jgi:3-hydroxyacyl-[acyl-carrier-protein] dehydratase